MTSVHVTGLCKRWGDTHAVRDVSFTVPEGSLTVLLGPSGCGKSTTLRLIAGLEDASAGRISIGGNDVTHIPAAKRDISMVFQSYALFPHLSVAENILFGLKVRRVPKTEQDARLKKTADLLGLSELLERKPAEISGGQQQRVALGRAVISERPICLMDEPLSNLDAKLRHEMRIELRALQQKIGMTMIYVTHDQTEAISMADQIVLLNNGEIEQAASPVEIYEAPSTLFGARFVGTPPMNMLKIRDTGDAWHVDGTAFPIQTTLSGTPPVLGLRPEAIRLVEDGGCQATLLSGEYLGADTLLDFQMGEQTLSVRTTRAAIPPKGSVMRLDWSADAQHFFDPNTGHRRTELVGTEQPDGLRVSAGAPPSIRG